MLNLWIGTQTGQTKSLESGILSLDKTMRAVPKLFITLVWEMANKRSISEAKSALIMNWNCYLIMKSRLKVLKYGFVDDTELHNWKEELFAEISIGYELKSNNRNFVW